MNVLQSDSEHAPQVEAVEVLTPRGRRLRLPREQVRAWDFRQSGFLAPSELRRIRLRHEQFLRSLAARLAVLLRIEFALHIDRVGIVSYQKFTEGLPQPTHITLFRVDPLKGVGLLAMPPRLGLALVDRLLGGMGLPPEADRELSEIEGALLDQIQQLILNEWCLHWPEMRELRPAILGHETNSRFLQTAPPDAAVLVLSLKGGPGEYRETLQMAFPYMTLEPLTRLLAPPLGGDRTPPAARAEVQWKAEFSDLPVPVSVEWTGLQMNAGDLGRLRPGSLLLLDGSALSVRLRLNGVPRFLGRPGIKGGRWAVELKAPISS
ncbi:MAG: flagellar motor switch protein FliM [Verrucomicrobiota bacterium]|nr:flagellar motor switch protein FliM [Limisphaera sp.]MDW8381035.1 flagellar motor switch protein FliM [Verrucomicrobiota bacterium]